MAVSKGANFGLVLVVGKKILWAGGRCLFAVTLTYMGRYWSWSWAWACARISRTSEF